MDRTDVDVDCSWSATRLVCAVAAEHTIANHTDATTDVVLTLDSKSFAATSIYVDGRPAEPFALAEPGLVHPTTPSIRLHVAPRAVDRLVMQGAVTLTRIVEGQTGGDGDPDTIWTYEHPLLAREEWRFWPLMYCSLANTNMPDPILRHIHIPATLTVAEELTRSLDADECLLYDTNAQSWTIELRRETSFVGRGGLIVNAGYASHEGWVGEVGYEIAIKQPLALELAAHVNSRHDVEIAPMIGFPLILRVGLPFRVADKKLAFRIQAEYRRRWRHVVALGALLYIDVWRDEPSHVGLLFSASL